VLAWSRWRDRASALMGLIGAGLSLQYISNLIRAAEQAEDELDSVIPDKGSETARATRLPRPYMIYWPPPQTVPWKRDIQICHHQETEEPLLADLWSPPGGTPGSGVGVIFLHGSGWHYADKDMGTRQFFRHLARQGHVILDVAYRLAPKAKLSDMLGDVKRSILWMKSHAAEYNVDPDKIVLMGGSAGAHLALLAAYAPQHPGLEPQAGEGDASVAGVVSYYGPPDLENLAQNLQELPNLVGKSPPKRGFKSFLEWVTGFEAVPVHEMLPNFLGAAPEDSELYRLASPIQHAGDHCPPTLLLQSEHDLSGMAPDVHRLYTTLKNEGVPVIYFEAADTEHGFDLVLPQLSPSAQAATYVTERFLARIAQN